MRTFFAGDGRVQSLAYCPDGQSLIVDLRDPARDRLCSGCNLPARELVWWDWRAASATRRFRLRDSLYGPGGANTGNANEDWSPEAGTLDVSFSVNPLLVATAWEWTNKEDGICVYDAEKQQTIDLWVPYKTHTLRLAISPDGKRLAVATQNDMDGSSLFEIRDLESPPCEDQDSALEETLVNSFAFWNHILEQRVQEAAKGCCNPFYPLHTLAFDGRFVAASGPRGTFLVWGSHADRLPVKQAEEDPAAPEAPEVKASFIPGCLAFAGKRHLLAVGGEGLGLYHCLTDTWTSFERSGATINAVTFAADGQLLLAGTEAGTIELWDVRTQRLVHGLTLGHGPITVVAFASDGHTAAAGTGSGQVIIWDRD
jgi:WD40 repeat protein